MEQVLVVEDDPIIGLDLAEELSKAGFGVVGPATSVKAALDLLMSSTCSAAVLDANLGTETAEPIACQLTRLGVPYLVISGYGNDHRLGALNDVPVLGKPFSTDHLIERLRALIAQQLRPAVSRKLPAS